MRIIKYKTLLNKDKLNILVKERSVNYQFEQLNNPELIAQMMNDVFELNKQSEEFLYIVAVNTKCKPIGVFEVSHGTVNNSFFSPREIFIKALLTGAVYIILAHNHPSGDITPSPDDVEATKRIKEAGDLIGIGLLDHIIVGDQNYYSFKENKLVL